MRVIPEVPGILSSSQVLATARSIAGLQRPNGMIPWFPGGHCDPWNHVEAAMALTTVGLDAEADRAYQWLVDTQLPDGSWFNYYLASSIEDPRLDTNVCAYLATGAWHHFISTGDTDGLESLWPAVEAGIDFVLRWQRTDGSICWSVDPAGYSENYALLTGSSSIYHSLRCAVACAERLGHERPDWEWARPPGPRHGLRARRPSPRKRSSPWTGTTRSYPGRSTGGAARHRIEAGWSTFVMEGFGVRCVSTGEWVTAAETAECVLALDALGMDDVALTLLEWGQGLRTGDGSYWTGMVYPEEPRSRPWSVPPTRRRHGAGCRRTEPYDAGIRAVPRRGPAHASGPHGTGPEAPTEPAFPAVPRAPSESGRHGSAAVTTAARPGARPPLTRVGATRLSTRSEPHSPSSVNSPESRAGTRAQTVGDRRRRGRGTRRGWPAGRPAATCGDQPR